MRIVRFETEHVARQVEGSDLAAAIGKNLVGAYGARHDLVHIVRRFILAKDLCVPAVGHRGAHQVNRICKRAVGYLLSSWQIVCGSTGETGGDCVLRQHCWPFNNRGPLLPTTWNIENSDIIHKEGYGGPD